MVGSSMMDIRQPATLALRMADAIAASGLGKTTLYAAIRSGQLRARKAGGRTLILRDDLETFLRNLPEVQ